MVVLVAVAALVVVGFLYINANAYGTTCKLSL